MLVSVESVRKTENECNGRDDRVKDCVWVPSLPADKIFNSEQDYLNAAT